VGAAACKGLVSGDATPVAIVVLNPPDTILLGDTVDIIARALNRSGDTIGGAPIALQSLKPDTIGIDSARLAVIGLASGSGDVLARSGNLPSSTFRIVVQ
jgi:hypothetical protein